LYNAATIVHVDVLSATQTHKLLLLLLLLPLLLLLLLMLLLLLPLQVFSPVLDLPVLCLTQAFQNAEKATTQTSSTNKENWN